MFRYPYFFVFFLLLGAADLPAESSKSSHEFLQKIWSPYCKGNSLLECPSGKAENLRNEIEKRLGQGESQESIMKDLEARYGDQIYMVPDANRAFWLPWVLFFLVLLGLLIFVMKRRKAKLPINKPQKDEKPSSELESKVLDDLKEHLD